MIWIILIYLVAVAFLFAGFLLLTLAGILPPLLKDFATPIACGLIGGVGGILYCLRAIYVNKCVKKRWDSDWNIWYFSRPIASTICGAVSYIFLKSGLILLGSDPQHETSNIGLYALAFVAGLNVDGLVARIENLAQSTWGIEKSRMKKEKD